MQNELIPYSDLEKMGKNIAESKLFGVKTAQEAVALMLVAQALGKHPALAVMEYNIIQGRPAKKADAMMGDFQASGGKIEWHSLTDELAEATFTHPQGGSLRLTWDIARAKKANLYEKDGSMYKKYPRQILRARLIVDGVRAVYPAATGGVRAVEEFDDTPEVEHEINPKKSRLENVIEAQAEPNSKSEPIKPEIVKPEPVKIEPAKAEASKPEPIKEPAKPLEVDITQIALTEGQKLATGFILEPANYATVDKDGKPTKKYNFKMGESKYGTFDQKVFEEISALLDIQSGMQKDDKEAKILVHIIYTERNKDGKIFKDIFKFIQASTAKVIPI